MTAFGTGLHTDTDSIKTSAEHGNPGDGSSRWFHYSRIADAGDAAQGGIADAAVTNPASSGTVIALLKGLLTGDGAVGATAVTDPTASGSVIALLKGILTYVRNSAAGILKSEDAAHASGDAGVMTLGVRNDALAARSGTDGDYTPIATDAAGVQFSRISVPSVQTVLLPTNSTSTAYQASRVVKATPGVLLGVTGYNSKATAQFIQLHDAVSLPADGGVPVITISVAGTSNFSLDLGVYGRYFPTGIVICDSSTGPTKTIGAADCWFDVQYV